MVENFITANKLAVGQILRLTYNDKERIVKVVRLLPTFMHCQQLPDNSFRNFSYDKIQGFELAKG